MRSTDMYVFTLFLFIMYVLVVNIYASFYLDSSYTVVVNHSSRRLKWQWHPDDGFFPARTSGRLLLYLNHVCSVHA